MTSPSSTGTTGATTTRSPAWCGSRTRTTGNLQTFTYTSSATPTPTSASSAAGSTRSDPTRPAGVDIAVAGDTVHVHTGTYPEQAIIDKADITVDGYGATVPVVDDGAHRVGTA